MYQTNRHIRFLATRAMRASDHAASVRAKAEAMDEGSFKDYLFRLAADYDRIAKRATEQIRRDEAASAENRRLSRLRGLVSDHPA
jgi:hypothetical protein